MYVGKLGLSWFFVNCYALFYCEGSLWHTSSRTCVITRGKVSLLDRCQTLIFLAVTGLWCSGKVSLLASKKNLSIVVVTSHSSCVFHYLFSSANILLVRFGLHLQDWWCVGQRETTCLPPSLWPLTMRCSKWLKYFSNRTNMFQKVSWRQNCQHQK